MACRHRADIFGCFSDLERKRESMSLRAGGNHQAASSSLTAGTNCVERQTSTVTNAALTSERQWRAARRLGLQAVMLTSRRAQRTDAADSTARRTGRRGSRPFLSYTQVSTTNTPFTRGSIHEANVHDVCSKFLHVCFMYASSRKRDMKFNSVAA